MQGYRAAEPGRNFDDMITVVRLVRILLILVLAALTVAFVVGLGRPEVGAVEKVALLALVAGCVVLAAKISTLASKAQQRLQHH